jgi:hypothetical protein
MPLTIYDEILRRDFTKRQMSIVFFVFRVSMENHHNYAKIDKLKYFQLCGISPTKIQKELTQLVDFNVFIIKGPNHYVINKNVKDWKVEIVKDWDEACFQTLLSNNRQDNI